MRSATAQASEYSFGRKQNEDERMETQLKNKTAKNRLHQTRYWNKKAGYEGKEDELTPEAKKLRYAYYKGKYREKKNEYGKAYYHRKKAEAKAEIAEYKRLIEELRKQIENISK